MNHRLLWMVPPAIVMSIAEPAYAIEYLSVAEAQKIAFPAATDFAEANIIFTEANKQAIQKLSGQEVRVGGEQVWKAQAGDTLLGFFFLDYVIGKHLEIDYAVALSPDGRVLQVEVLNYRESYGGEVAEAGWLSQFKGKTIHDPLQVNGDIINISGATLSSRHVTEGIKRVLAIFEECLR